MLSRVGKWLRTAGWLVSHLDTLLSWLARIGLAKVLVGAVLWGLTLLIGFVTGYDWPVVLLAAFVVAVLGIWGVNNLLEASNQRAIRKAIQAGTFGNLPGSTRPPASKDELGQNVIRGRSVWFADLVRNRPAATSPIISYRTFEDCDLHGPAVIRNLDGARWEQSLFDGDPASTFHIAEPDRGYVGVIGVEHVKVRRCSVYGVGFLVTAEEFEVLKKEFGL